MKRINALVFFFLLSFSAGSALAQTGKIAGQVTDEGSGEGLPGVNVVIEGTTQGTTTDVDGYYSIINVRSGSYDLRATFVGFAPQLVQGIRVTSGLTSTVDIQMREEAIGLDQVVVTAERPIIQKDISGSQSVIDSESLQSGTFQNVNNVVGAQVGSDATGVYNDRPRIRGSALEESKFIVDGIDQSDVLTNRPYQRINLDAVEEVQMLTGGFSAEYGNLQSGVVNVVTKTGGESYSGSFNFQYSPPGLKHFGPMPYGHEGAISLPFVDAASGAFTGNDFFQGWDAESLSPSRDPQHTGSPEELWALWMWRHRSQDSIDKLQDLGYVQFAEGVNPDDEVFHETGDLPDYNMNATLGGPVPGLNNVRFFMSYDRTQTEYAAAFPEDAYREANFRGKLTANLGQNTRLDVHSFFGRQKGGDGGQGPGPDGYISTNPYRQWGGSNKFWYANCAVPGQQTRQIYGGQLTHTFDANSFMELDLSHHRVDYEMLNQIRNTAPLPAVEGQTSRLQGVVGQDVDPEGDLYLPDVSNPSSPNYIQGYENWQDWAKIKIGDYWYDEGPVGYSPVWWVDVTGYYRMSSCNVRSNDTRSRSYDFKGAYTTQMNRHNQLRAGFQLRSDDIFQDYRALDPSVNGGSIQVSDATPWTVGGFIEDKLEYEGFVANIGLRLDGFISGSFPILDNSDGAADDGVYSQFLLAGNTTGTDTDGNATFELQNNIGQERSQQWKLSPRVGISHPISTVAKLFFNYGHMYQRPTAYQQYRVQYNTREGSRIRELGNPALEPTRTIQYEVGYEHNLADRVSLRGTGYYKDVTNRIGQSRYYPLGQNYYERYENNSFRDIRGLEFTAELRRDVIPYFSGYFSANYLIESGGSFGFDRYFQDPTLQPRQVSGEVSDPDVRPIFRTGINFSTPQAGITGGLDIALSHFWQRGAQFTWNPAEIPLVENNVRWKPYQRFDLRLNKDLYDSKDFNASFYMDVRNLFNNKNITNFNYSGGDIRSENTIQNEHFAWSGQKWFNNTEIDYLNSLGYTAANQNTDGTFDTDQSIGDSGDGVALPPFDSFTFLERRDIFFGIRLQF